MVSPNIQSQLPTVHEYFNFQHLCGWHVIRKVIWYVTKLPIFEILCNIYNISAAVSVLYFEKNRNRLREYSKIIHTFLFMYLEGQVKIKRYGLVVECRRFHQVLQRQILHRHLAHIWFMVTGRFKEAKVQ